MNRSSNPGAVVMGCATTCIAALTLSLVAAPPSHAGATVRTQLHTTVLLESVVTDLRNGVTVPAPAPASAPRSAPAAARSASASTTDVLCGWVGGLVACVALFPLFLLVVVSQMVQSFIQSVQAFLAKLFPSATPTPVAAVRASVADHTAPITQAPKASVAPARPAAHRSPRIRPAAGQPLVLPERVIRVVTPTARAKAAASASASRSADTRTAGATGRSARTATN